MFENIILNLRRFDRRLWILGIGWIASATGFSISIPFIALYFHSELGMSLSEIGLFFGVSAIIRASSQAMAGELSDRLGRYPLMVFAQLVRSIIFLVMAYYVHKGHGFIVVGSLLILNTMFGALFQPAAQAMVADLVEAKDRTNGYAIVRVAGNFGWAIGPFIGGLVAAKSYSFLFIISGCMTFVSSMIIARFLKGVRQQERDVQPFSFRSLLNYRENRLIFQFAAYLLLLYIVIAQLIMPLSLYTVDIVGISKPQLGLLFAINGLMVTIFQLPTTHLMRKFKLTSQLILGAIVFGCGYFLVGVVATFVFFIGAMIIITIAENITSPPALALTANLAPAGKTGRYMGFYGFAVTFGWSLGPLVGSSLLEWVDPNYLYMWGIIAVLSFISAIGFRQLAHQLPDNMNFRDK